jgi:hypothetical protein
MFEVKRVESPTYREMDKDFNASKEVILWLHQHSTRKYTSTKKQRNVSLRYFPNPRRRALMFRGNSA